MTIASNERFSYLVLYFIILLFSCNSKNKIKTYNQIIDNSFLTKDQAHQIKKNYIKNTVQN